MLFRRIWRRLDYVLLCTVLLVIAFSLITIASATHITTPKNVGEESQLLFGILNLDAMSFVIKQLIWTLMGLIIMLAVIFFSYEDWPKYARALYIFNVLMLMAVIFIGKTALGAQRWIAVGPFVLQPSEFAKIIIIVTFANFLANREGKLNTIKDFIPAFAFIGFPMLLILMQPDLGTSLVFMAIMFGMMFMAGANPKLLGGIIGGGGLVGFGWLYAYFKNPGKVWIPLHDYQVDRLTIFMDPYRDPLGDGYHIIQSQIAIGSGGLFGKGIFNGSQNQLNFLPEQHTDFIFSVVGEEFGFVGTVLVLALFFIIVYRGIFIASQAKDTFGTLLAAGVVSMMVFHILVNVGMTVGIMPVTGLPLPFFSYGGSSMITNMIAIGILQNVYSRRKKLVF
ncbi:rod shape determining protein RodA [Desulfohalotomaculum tongense]|uniref:rod shape-determining protein RodA n=1 Tax=Desulforadius tongensis TaxID=1216062 RepID=UPI001959F622|nr:rod shape-determining protein RodA [Desulforadius tongensis]MBM7854524.1 rod shape determining protein RodA [Desulforadius tongensis]